MIYLSDVLNDHNGGNDKSNDNINGKHTRREGERTDGDKMTKSTRPSFTPPCPNSRLAPRKVLGPRYQQKEKKEKKELLRPSFRTLAEFYFSI